MTKKKAILIVSSLLGLIVAYGFWQFKAIGKIDQTPSADINDASFWDRQFERESSEKRQIDSLKDELEGNSKKERIQNSKPSKKTSGKKANDSEGTNRKTTEPKVSIVYSKNYLVNLGGLERMHPFDIKKYEKIVNGLVEDKVLKENQIFRPKEVTSEEIQLVHSETFLKNIKDKSKLAGYLESSTLNVLPYSVIERGMLQAFRYSTGGTILASRLALKSGIAVNVGGGYHHAKVNVGEGFCIYADVPIAIRVLQKEKLIKKALVVDLDVHQGNGTAVCLADDDTTFTFSMHQGNIYPMPKEKSDWDIELKGGMKDDEYIKTLENSIPKMFEKSKPDIVFIVGGCDTLDGDPLANLKMTEKGIAKRDAMIIKAAVSRKVPVVLTLSGGYSKNAWRSQYLSIKNVIESFGLSDKKDQK